jgi:hypothetical protein
MWYDQLWYSPAGLLAALAFAWTIIWKGFALWKAARRKQIVWFAVLLVVNTVGILEILYIFLFGRDKDEEKVTGAMEIDEIERDEDGNESIEKTMVIRTRKTRKKQDSE